MSALSPWFLAAAVSVAVPIFLHLFQRRQVQRFSFPALRYLERTEREHARRIRLRQLLLLIVRVCILLVLVGAGARLVFAGRGSAHPPTAVAIVLDNSLSSGLVDGDRRVLDDLKARAAETLNQATHEDRFWIIRAGEAWLPALPGGAEEARIALDATEPSHAAGNLTDAVQRAVELVSSSELPRKEVHVLSDLQASALAEGGAPGPLDLPVIVWNGSVATSTNRALTGAVVGGGLPPLEGQRTSLAIRAVAPAGDTMPVPVRVFVNDRMRGATSLPPETEGLVGLPPFESGWVLGYADLDPDGLRADDRRYFAFRSRRPAAVSLSGPMGMFAEQALAVLSEAGRARTAAPSSADVLLSSEGTGLDGRRIGSSSLIVPPSDPTRLPALNRRLAQAGIDWQYVSAPTSGAAVLEGSRLPPALSGIEVRVRYRLVQGEGSSNTRRVLAEAGGSPWAVEGTDDAGRRYLLLGSALDQNATTLPVSTGMVRFLDWVIAEWAGSSGAVGDQHAGVTLFAPSEATHVRDPGGSVAEIDGTRMVRGTARAGFYTFLASDTVVSVVAVNPPPEESDPAFADLQMLESALGSGLTVVDDPGRWGREIYQERRGPEIWWPLLLTALVLLIAETVIGASRRSDTKSSFGAVAAPSEADARA